MARIQKALLMSVGTPVGNDEEEFINLAKGLTKSIHSTNPDLIIFIGSEQSKKTIEYIKEFYSDDPRFELDFYEFIQIDDIDSFHKYYDTFESQIKRLNKDYQIVIDYTTGTKDMSMAAAIASLLYDKQLIRVSGKRKDGRIIPGTEVIKTQNFFKIRDMYVLDSVYALFNLNRFETAKYIIKLFSDNVDKELYINFLSVYSCFDNVDYENALKYFDAKAFNKNFKEISRQLNKNIKALGVLNNPDNALRCKYVLANMLNNARRRADESKYDDAIARLYRSLELIAQIKLKDYGLKSSNIDLEIIAKHNLDVDYYESLRDEKTGDIKISLHQDYELLARLDDPIGQYYLDNKSRFIGSLILRNDSILAHGFKSKSKEDYESFAKLVLEIANVYDKDIGKYIDHTKFPFFDIYS